MSAALPEKSLKSAATRGMLWNALETFSVQAGQFIISIVLARLLMPSDFGLIGMLAIFIAVSQTFVDSGMGKALIQKKNRTSIDFSTVFVFNLAVSLFIYLIVFSTAPFIADFYEKPQLIVLSRVLMLNIVINSLSLVQISRLTIDLDFKAMAKVNVFSVIISGICAIGLAYSGFGVWALVFQNLIRASVSVLMLWYLSHWKPSVKFSRASFNALFGFGSKLLGAGLIATLFNNIYKVIIGKAYTAKDLGYYTQSVQFADVTSGSVTSILQKVTFPILSTIQDDEKRLISVYKKLIGMTTFVIFPIMILLAVLADPFIRYFLTDKWLPAVPLLQWLCFARIVHPISALNMNILNVKGRSDLFLKTDLSKLPIIIVILIITVPMGIKAVVIGHVISSLISFFINAYMPGRLFGYGAIKQLKDMMPKIICALLMGGATLLVCKLFESSFSQLAVGGITGVTSYMVFCYVAKIDELREVFTMILTRLRSS